MRLTDDEFLAIFHRATSHGWLDQEEARLLLDAACETTGAIVEVGCYQGRSAMMLGCLREGGDLRKLYCVDPWDDKFSSDLPGSEIFARFCDNIRDVGEKVGEALRVVPVRSRVEDWPGLGEPVGLFYCDGDHTYEGTRAQLLKAVACKPQVIAMHDICSGGEGAEVMRAALDTFKRHWDAKAAKLAVWRFFNEQLPKVD